MAGDIGTGATRWINEPGNAHHGHRVVLTGYVVNSNYFSVKCCSCSDGIFPMPEQALVDKAQEQATPPRCGERCEVGSATPAR